MLPEIMFGITYSTVAFDEFVVSELLAVVADTQMIVVSARSAAKINFFIMIDFYKLRYLMSCLLKGNHALVINPHNYVFRLAIKQIR